MKFESCCGGVGNPLCAFDSLDFSARAQRRRRATVDAPREPKINRAPYAQNLAKLRARRINSTPSRRQLLRPM